jgi:hypothetical protein
VAELADAIDRHAGGHCRGGDVLLAASRHCGTRPNSHRDTRLGSSPSLGRRPERAGAARAGSRRGRLLRQCAHRPCFRCPPITDRGCQH